LQFIQIIVSGIAIGCVYGLIAQGFVLIYKATEAVNFAQGDLMMLGAFFALTTTGIVGLPYWAGVAIAVVLMALLGMLVEWSILRPILGQPTFTVLMVTVGFGYVARGGVTMIPGWGGDTHALAAPYKGEIVRLGSLILGMDQVVVIATTVLVCAALYFFFRFTKLGIAMQASSQNQLAAYYVGIPVKRINSLIWAISALVAGIAGVVLAPISFVYANMGFIGLKAFPAAVVGGFGSVPGAMAGGLVIGLIEALAGRYLPEGFKDVAAYVVVLLMLLIRPNGLFGENLRKRV